MRSDHRLVAWVAKIGESTQIQNIRTSSAPGPEAKFSRALGIVRYRAASGLQVRYHLLCSMCGASKSRLRWLRVPDVRFTPKSGHFQRRLRCPLSAISGHGLISHLNGWRVWGGSHANAATSIEAHQPDSLSKFVPFQGSRPVSSTRENFRF